MERLYYALQASFIALLAILTGLLLSTRLKARKRLPPGPTPWPVVGNLMDLGVLPHQTLAKLAKQFGPLMSIRLGSMNCVVVSSPKFAEEFLKANDQVWASRPPSAAGELLCLKYHEIGAAPYGPRWRYARKIFMLELLTSKRLAEFQKSRRKELLSAVRVVIDESDSGKAARMDVILNRMTMNISINMLMKNGGLSDQATAVKDNQNFLQTLKETFVLAGVFNIGDFIPWLDWFDLQGYRERMKITAKKLDDFYQDIIDDHREKHKMKNYNDEDNTEDFVDVLLTRPSDADGQHLTDLAMKGIMQDVLLGGTDTTANTIEWGLSELIKNPRVMRKAQEEIDSIVGRERTVEESDLPNLPYLQAVVKEILRLHPVSPLMVPHESTQVSTIGGYQFPAKTRLFVNVFAIHRDPEVWERPLEFYPERFLHQKIDVMGLDFKLIPFGSGRRMCPGKNLALISVPTDLAFLIHACDWHLPGGQTPEDLDMAETYGMTVPRKNPLRAIAVPRLSRHVFCDLKD